MMGRQLPVVLGILFISASTSCLELTSLKVPRHVPLGTRASLSCRWQLSPADVLYSVKWYKDGREFFRHVPRDTEPRRQFPLPGVHVEKSDTLGSELTLGAAVLETSGRYRCEVSGERPLFPTVSEHADLLVVELPASGPVITGLKTRYRISDRIQVNCTSGRSRPATRLSWYVNGEPAAASAELVRTVHPDGLETASLGLDFEVMDEDFRKGAVKVKCLSTIGSVYWRSNEESALEKKVSFGSTATERLYDSPTIWRENIALKSRSNVIRSDALLGWLSVIYWICMIRLMEE